MATYPAGVYSPRAKENKSGVVYDASKKTTTFVEDITKLDDEVVAIETMLGPNKVRVGTIDDSATPTPTGDSQDIFTITALAQNATIGTPGGTPVNGQKLIIRILDAGAAKTLAWNAIYRAGTDVALPTTTVLSKTLYCGFIYNSAATKWDLVAVVNNI